MRKNGKEKLTGNSTQVLCNHKSYRKEKYEKIKEIRLLLSQRYDYAYVNDVHE
jgi:hypothetical protein